MNYFDLHCDTALVNYNTNTSFGINEHQLSLDKVRADKYVQLAAIWSRCDFSDDAAYDNYHNVLDYLRRDLSSLPVSLCKTAADIDTAHAQGKAAFILALEGARIARGDVAVIDELYRDGVRALTLLWGGVDCIGGAHNTDEGLTDFGKAVVRRCFEYGIAVDVSHASDASFNDAAGLAQKYDKPLIATHSLSRAVCYHKRNLTDEQFLAIAERGGIVGMTFVPPFIKQGVENGAELEVGDIVAHIRHFYNLAGVKNIAVGTDYDGMDASPRGVENVSGVPNLYNALVDGGFTKTEADAIFYDNAYEFFKRLLK